VETTAYWVALISIVLFPPAMLLWFIIHPFTRTWRKLGLATTYLVAIAILVSVMVGIYLAREPLLRIRYGVSWPLVVFAGFLFVAANVVKAIRAKHLTFRIRFGLPQLSGSGEQGRLITEGIYAHVRNPTYLEGGLGLASVAVFSNYLALYVLLAAYVPIIYLITLLEERELRERFGEEFERYRREVPRFVPRLFRRKKGGAESHGTERRPANNIS